MSSASVDSSRDVDGCSSSCGWADGIGLLIRVVALEKGAPRLSVEALGEVGRRDMGKWESPVRRGGVAAPSEMFSLGCEGSKVDCRVGASSRQNPVGE